MKIKLELSLDNGCLELLKERKGDKVTMEDMKEELTQMLFEVCEGWVLRQDEPNLEFEEI